jgi:hypothetical protein
MSELLRAFWTVASDRDGEAAKRHSLSSPSQSLWVSHFAKRYLKKYTDQGWSLAFFEWTGGHKKIPPFTEVTGGIWWHCGSLASQFRIRLKILCAALQVEESTVAAISSCMNLHSSSRRPRVLRK